MDSSGCPTSHDDRTQRSSPSYPRSSPRTENPMNPAKYVFVVITLANWARYTVSTADTPEAIQTDRVNPDCGWHISQTWN